MINDDTAAEVIRDLARESTEPRKLELGGYYVAHTAEGVKQIDLTGDGYLEYPKRKAGTVTVSDVAAFAQYHKKHADDDTEVFADLDGATITAVLDAHLGHSSDQLDFNEGGARWQKHRVTLAMRKTPQWVAWTGKDRVMMPQHDFAEFLEDNAPDIAADSPVSATDLIELAQEFHTNTDVAFSSGKRLQSGMTQLVYTENINASGGNRGTVIIPDDFHLGIKPFDDSDPFRIKARFRYRIKDSALFMGYHLDQPADAFRRAVNDVVEKTQDACDGVVIMRGKPA